MEKSITNKLKAGMISVFVANIINLIINLLTSFILPKYLSVDSYAAIKTYHLYVAYAGVLSFGYVDGMFLKYGGIDFEKLDFDDVNRNLSTFRIFQTAVVVLTLITVLVFRDPILVAFAIATLPINMAGYYRSLYQSIGEFKTYSRIMNMTASITFLTNLILIFILRTDNYLYYLVSYVALNIIIWLLLEINFRKKNTRGVLSMDFSMQELIHNVKDGILLMLGNFSNIILTSMDRWFIKALMTTIDFAQYSFACSMENFINVAATPITVTFYNYFCKVNDDKIIKSVRNLIMIAGAALIACSFPGKFILEVYLTQYIEASKVMFFLFAAQLFYIINKSVYVNLYKARHQQNKYFIKLVCIIVIGFVFNIVCYYILHNKEAFAIGTLLSAVIWLVLSAIDFPGVSFNAAEITYILSVSILFLVCGYLFEAIVGFFIYCVGFVILSLIFVRSDFIRLFGVIGNKLRKRSGK